MNREERVGEVFGFRSIGDRIFRRMPTKAWNHKKKRGGVRFSNNVGISNGFLLMGKGRTMPYDRKRASRSAICPMGQTERASSTG